MFGFGIASYWTRHVWPPSNFPHFQHAKSGVLKMGEEKLDFGH